MTKAEISILSKYEVANLFKEAELKRLAGEELSAEFAADIVSIVGHHGHRISDALLETHGE